MFPPESSASAGPFPGTSAAEQSGDRGRTGALDDELHPLEQEHDRLRDLAVGHRDDAVEPVVQDPPRSARPAP